MNNNQVKDEIRLIREMIEKTKKIHAESWKFFFLWGIVVILGIMGMYALVFFKKFNLIWLNWFTFMGIGVIIQIFFIVKQEQSQEVKTYAHNAVAHLGFACGMAFMFTGFILPLLKIYSYGVIPIMVSVIAGIIIFTLGGIYEWNFLKWCGVIWWLGALGMVFVHWHYRTLIVAPLIIIGYLVPGFILHARYKKSKQENVK
ncbi:MAG: hypothetical protein KAS65_03160 [Candidatus Aminicenantes bacterium]|nr:hypothetical protein [Candidatus Aminicenantes bacterium]